MADAGKDPLPELKKSINISKNTKTFKYFGQAQENLIIIFKQKKLGAK